MTLVWVGSSIARTRRLPTRATGTARCFTANFSLTRLRRAGSRIIASRLKNWMCSWRHSAMRSRSSEVYPSRSRTSPSAWPVRRCSASAVSSWTRIDLARLQEDVAQLAAAPVTLEHRQELITRDDLLRDEDVPERRVAVGCSAAPAAPLPAGRRVTRPSAIKSSPSRTVTLLAGLLDVGVRDRSLHGGTAGQRGCQTASWHQAADKYRACRARAGGRRLISVQTAVKCLRAVVIRPGRDESRRTRARDPAGPAVLTRPP